MSKTPDAICEYEFFKAKKQIASRIKSGDLTSDFEPEPITLTLHTFAIGGIREELEIVTIWIGKLYSTSAIRLSHIDVSAIKSTETITGAAIITINNVDIIRSLVAEFFIEYKRINGKATKVHNLTSLTIA
jgi:hypothetical protein